MGIGGVLLISDNIGMSPVYLERLFKKQTNKSMADYINDTRIKEAIKIYHFFHTNYQ
jgi:AraC-like DNA-binding protein